MSSILCATLQGHMPGRNGVLTQPVPSTKLGMNTNDWDTSLELEAFLEYCFRIKDVVEFKSFLTGAQAYILFWHLMQGCQPHLPLVVKLHPQTARMSDRERKEEVRSSQELDIATKRARITMWNEMQSRFFEGAERPSNVCPHIRTPLSTRLVRACMWPCA